MVLVELDQIVLGNSEQGLMVLVYSEVENDEQQRRKKKKELEEVGDTVEQEMKTDMQGEEFE